jgi:hypothetical protein
MTAQTSFIDYCGDYKNNTGGSVEYTALLESTSFNSWQL